MRLLDNSWVPFWHLGVHASDGHECSAAPACRIASNKHAVWLRGDIAAHGFEAGPLLTFSRGRQPVQARVFTSLTFPFLFVSTSYFITQDASHAERSHTSGSGRAGATDRERPGEPGDQAQTPAAAPPFDAHDHRSVQVACFDAEDTLAVVHAVARWLTQQRRSPRDAPASRCVERLPFQDTAQLKRLPPEDAMGMAVSIVPVSPGAPVIHLTADEHGYSVDELNEASSASLEAHGVVPTYQLRSREKPVSGVAGRLTRPMP